MNKVILMGRLTRDPDIRYTQGDSPMCIARYTLAVDRRFNRNNDDGNNADFIPCVCFEGQHKRQPEFPVVTRESRRNSRKTTWFPVIAR